jgi:hypothetical protein
LNNIEEVDEGLFLNSVEYSGYTNKEKITIKQLTGKNGVSDPGVSNRTCCAIW